MFCPCCKQELIGTEPFCPGCGMYISSDMIVKTEAKHHTSMDYAMFFCVGMLAMFILIYLLGTQLMLLFVPLIFLRLGSSRLAAVLFGGVAGAILGFLLTTLV